MENMFTKEELISFNEKMLQRGVPNTQDNIGFNKSDYMVCATYFYGLSNAQYGDLAKRLIKYTKTQLGVDREAMKETAKYYAELSEGQDRSNGISIDIKEDGTLISFRYNEEFIAVVKNQPKRQWDSVNKNWIVPNDRLIPILNELCTVGADVSNALEYAMNSEIIVNAVIRQEINKVEVLTKLDGDYAFLKFDFNKHILEEIKRIDKNDRQWNSDFKFWLVNKSHLQSLQQKLSEIAIFKLV